MPSGIAGAAATNHAGVLSSPSSRVLEASPWPRLSAPTSGNRASCVNSSRRRYSRPLRSSALALERVALDAVGPGRRRRASGPPGSLGQPAGPGGRPVRQPLGMRDPDGPGVRPPGPDLQIGRGRAAARRPRGPGWVPGQRLGESPPSGCAAGAWCVRPGFAQTAHLARSPKWASCATMRPEYFDQPPATCASTTSRHALRVDAQPVHGCAHRCTFCYVRAFAPLTASGDAVRPARAHQAERRRGAAPRAGLAVLGA